MTNLAIAVNGLRKSYSDEVVLNGINRVRTRVFRRVRVTAVAAALLAGVTAAKR